MLMGWITLPDGYDPREEHLITAYRRLGAFGENSLIMKRSLLSMLATAVTEVALANKTGRSNF